MTKVPIPTLKREAGFVFLAHLQVFGEMRWMFWLEVRGLPKEGVLPQEAYTPALLCPLLPGRKPCLFLAPPARPSEDTCVSVLDSTADRGAAGRSDLAHPGPLRTEGQSLKPPDPMGSPAFPSPCPLAPPRPPGPAWEPHTGRQDIWTSGSSPGTHRPVHLVPHKQRPPPAPCRAHLPRGWVRL